MKAINAAPPPTVAVPPAPEAVTRAFPGVNADLTDWRDYRPDTMTVAPYPDLPLKFTRTAVREEGRYITWIGRNPDWPGASFVGVATARGYDAILMLPGVGEFSFHVRGSDVVVAEIAPGQDSCGVAPVQAPKPSVPVSIGTTQAISYASGREPMPDTYAETAPIKVDVLVAYDADTLAAASAKSSDPTGYIDGQCKAMVESMNLFLGQSLVAAYAWRYLGAVAAPAYPRTGKLQVDIDAMKPGGAIAAWVKATRYQRGADQITLMIGGANDWGGIAGSPKQVAVAADFSNSVLKWGNSAKLWAHELAHNFGCKHDRAHYDVPTDLGPGAPATPAPDNDGFWCYGEMWTNPPIPGGTDPGTSGTIMSYADYQIPYFSNPNISVHVTGLLIGWSWNPDLGTWQTGRAETDPKAAYNARVLNEQALAMSNLSEEIVMPAITQQPVGGSVPRGSTLSLSVKASGGGLDYQWMKAGVAISGATAAAYSKTADDADAGDYSVKITNLAGSVTSNNAALTITAPPPAPVVVPAGSPGGSGGGGGAPSFWFFGCLALSVWARRRAGLSANGKDRGNSPRS